ncbi:MAG: diketogulonate related aldo/keto reductase [Haloquadratum sp. J07HQX50]|jgi:Aldo/keto reductases, related to diketogulonate reductase|nr:MAG: diketogulonate related aldo/keto reductase [Haloquadratum sp. J07HQX50]
MNQSAQSDVYAPTDDEMPMLGLGTWENTDPDACASAVKTAIEMGYRHIDTAQAYGNEADVGRGIEAASVPREELFIATKVWITNLSPDDIRRSTKESLNKLGLDYVDLLYIHWPARAYDPKASLAVFEKLSEEGMINHIGISNFEPAQVDQAIELTDAPIFANQIEIHPLLPQTTLCEHCEQQGVSLVAYSPLARGAVFEVPELSEIAEKHDVSEAQVSLAWLRKKGVTTIPKATSEAHIRDNWRSLQLNLDAADIEKIDSIEQTDRRVDPSFAPW